MDYALYGQDSDLTSRNGDASDADGVCVLCRAKTHRLRIEKSLALGNSAVVRPFRYPGIVGVADLYRSRHDHEADRRKETDLDLGSRMSDLDIHRIKRSSGGSNWNSNNSELREHGVADRSAAKSFSVGSALDSGDLIFGESRQENYSDFKPFWAKPTASFSNRSSSSWTNSVDPVQLESKPGDFVEIRSRGSPSSDLSFAKSHSEIRNSTWAETRLVPTRPGTVVGSSALRDDEFFVASSCCVHVPSRRWHGVSSGCGHAAVCEVSTDRST